MPPPVAKGFHANQGQPRDQLQGLRLQVPRPRPSPSLEDQALVLIQGAGQAQRVQPRVVSEPRSLSRGAQPEAARAGRDGGGQERRRGEGRRFTQQPVRAIVLGHGPGADARVHGG